MHDIVKRSSIRPPVPIAPRHVGQLQRKNSPAAPRNLVLIGRYVLERGNAVKDVMPVDGCDFSYVLVAR